MRFSTRCALVALAVGAALGSPSAYAQVQLFDEVPTQDQLRSILVPETTDRGRTRSLRAVPQEPEERGATRRIVIAPENVRPDPAQRPSKPASVTMPDEMPQNSAPQWDTSQEQDVRVRPARPQAKAEPPPQVEPDSQPAQWVPSPPKKVEAKLADPTKEAAAAVGFRINFALNSAVIPPDARGYLDSIAELLRQEKTLVLAVEGHTDARGADTYNMELSKRRAAAVSMYLEERGVSRDQLIPVGKGKSEPLVEDGMDGRNRRVQFNRVNWSG